MADEENPQEIQEPAPPPIPAVRMVIEDYNPEDAQHYAQWVASGRPDLPWQTTWYEDLAEDRETYVRRLQSESAPVTDVDNTPKPRTQALTVEELSAARSAIAQVVESAAKASNTAALKESVAGLAQAFDAVLAKLAGE